MCRACRGQTTVTAGTILDKTRTPLRVWLAAMWYVTNQKQGVSALGLQRVLGFGSCAKATLAPDTVSRRVGTEREAEGEGGAGASA